MKFRLAARARPFSGLPEGSTRRARAYCLGLASAATAGRDAARAEAAQPNMKLRLSMAFPTRSMHDRPDSTGRQRVKFSLQISRVVWPTLPSLGLCIRPYVAAELVPARTAEKAIKAE